MAMNSKHKKCKIKNMKKLNFTLMRGKNFCGFQARVELSLDQPKFPSPKLKLNLTAKMCVTSFLLFLARSAVKSTPKLATNSKNMD